MPGVQFSENICPGWFLQIVTFTKNHVTKGVGKWGIHQFKIDWQKICPEKLKVFEPYNNITLLSEILS